MITERCGLLQVCELLGQRRDDPHAVAELRRRRQHGRRVTRRARLLGRRRQLHQRHGGPGPPARSLVDVDPEPLRRRLTPPSPDRPAQQSRRRSFPRQRVMPLHRRRRGRQALRAAVHGLRTDHVVG